MKNTIRNLGTTALLGSALALNASSAEMVPTGRVETMFGNDLATIDTKVSLDLSSKVNLFGRATTTYNYDTSKATPFAFIDLSYSLGKGVSALYETQFIDLSDGTLVQPRLGLSYFKPLAKDLTLFSSLAFNIPQERDPKVNGENVTTISYSPKLGKDSKYNLVSQAELVTNVGENGLNFASQNFRLGIAKGKLEAGFALNLSETQSSSHRTLGGFVAYKF